MLTLLRLDLWRAFRLLIQAIIFLLMNAVVLGYNPLPLTLPIMQPLNTPTTVVGGNFEAINRLLAEGVFPFLAIGILMLVSTLVGRLMCGWACPFGFIQDIVSLTRSKYTFVATPTHMNLKKIKYYVLIITLFFAATLAIATLYPWRDSYRQALGFLYPNPYFAFDQPMTLFVVVPYLAFYPQVNGLMPKALGDIASINPFLIFRLAVLAFFLVIPAYIPRFWCRYFCPNGALVGLFGKHSILDIRRNPVRCETGCRECNDACPMQIDIAGKITPLIQDTECIKCFNCVLACPHNALKPSI